MNQLLELRDVGFRIDNNVILDDLKFSVAKGEAVALLGANGSGKTTILNLISRLNPVSSGDILFNGQSLLQFSPHELARRGISRVFQTSDALANMRLDEFIGLGRYSTYSLLRKLSFYDSLVDTTASDEWRITLREIHAVLGLDNIAARKLRELSYAQLRYAELAQATLVLPELLLLDELSTGLTAIERQPLKEAFSLLRSSGATILFIEHDQPFVSEVATRCIVIEDGYARLDGTPAAIRSVLSGRERHRRSIQESNFAQA